MAITPRQFRLEDEVVSRLDAICEYHGLDSRAAAIRFLVAKEYREIKKDVEPTNPEEKSK